MTAMAHEPLTQDEVLLEGFLALDTPEGFRAELVEAEIVVTPPPDGDHEDYIGLIVSQVIRRSRTDMQFSGN
jgi:Uma2 family endonuclease